MSELEILRVRDDVLQAMYWMAAEGISETPSADELSRFLTVPAPTLAPYLDRFVSDGYLEIADADAGYRLTTQGTDDGKRSFADEFAELTQPTHGDCDDDCWCHDSPDEAAACLEGRTSHSHAH